MGWVLNDYKKFLKAKYFWAFNVSVVLILCFFAGPVPVAMKEQTEYLSGYLSRLGFGTVADLRGTSLALDMDSMMRMITPQYALFAPLVYLNRFVCMAFLVYISFSVAQDYRQKTMRVCLAYNSPNRYLFCKVRSATLQVMSLYLLSGLLFSAVSLFYYGKLEIQTEFLMLYPISPAEYGLNILKLIALAFLFSLAAAIPLFFSASISFIARNPFFSLPLVFLYAWAAGNPNNIAYVAFYLLTGFESMGILFDLGDFHTYMNINTALTLGIYICLAWGVLGVFDRMKISLV